MFGLHFFSGKQKFALASGFLAIYFANQSIQALAIPYFQMTIGLDPLFLSVVLTLPILFVGWLSPVLGRWADNSRFSGNKRKPFILLFGWLAGIFFAGIWLVPVTWQSTYILLYLFIIIALYYVFVTVMTINIKCLAFESGKSEEQRLKVMSFTAVFDRLGAFTYNWLFPVAQWSLFGSVFIGIHYIGWFVGLILIALLATFCALFSSNNQSSNTENKQLKQQPNKLDFDRVTRRAFFIILTLFVIKIGIISAFSGFDYYLMVYYVFAGDLSQGAYWKGILSSTFAFFSLILIPVISFLTLKFGKIRSLIFIYSLSMMGSIAKWFIYTPGNEHFLYIDALLGASSFVAIAAILPAMLADLSAKTSAKIGFKLDGYFVSRQNKFVCYSIVGSALVSGFLLNVIGFDAKLMADQSQTSITSMRILLSGGTLFFNAISILILFFYPFKTNDSDAFLYTENTRLSCP